jgi:acylphosphatase/archaellum component FlaC
MKLKIVITGSKVHDVGYRVFLLKHAMNLAVPGLSVYNWEENGQQQVIALAEGDEGRITAFRKVAEEKRPPLAKVSDITFEPYDGDVGRTSELAMLCSFVQLDKAIPLLLRMDNRLGSMDDRLGSMDNRLGSMDDRLGSMDNRLGSMDDRLGSMDNRLGSMDDRLGSMDNRLVSVDDKLSSMDSKLSSVDNRLDLVIENQRDTVDEIRGLREDLVGSREWQLRVERDIKVIKSKLGIR